MTDDASDAVAGDGGREAAIEATRLLGKWMRIAQGHMSFGIGCTCGMGLVNIQARDFELQILDYLYGKHSHAGAETVLALLREHAGYRPGEAGSIAEFLRAIANQAPGLAVAPQLALLCDLERSIDSFDEVHRSCRWPSSRRPDPQYKSGSATAPMIRRGPRLRVAVSVRRNRLGRVDAETEESTR